MNRRDFIVFNEERGIAMHPGSGELVYLNTIPEGDFDEELVDITRFRGYDDDFEGEDDDFEGEDDELYLALGAGVGFEGGAALDAWSPRAALRFTHVHHAPLESWGDTPFSNVAGDSSGGVRHRSGAEAAVGLVAPSITDLWGQALRWELELSGGVLPSSSHFAWTTALVVGLSLDSVQ